MNQNKPKRRRDLVHILKKLKDVHQWHRSSSHIITRGISNPMIVNLMLGNILDRRPNR